MPKQSKTKAKTKAKQKNAPEPEAPSFTSKKSYWVMLTIVMTIAVSVAGFIVGLSLADTAVLAVTILLLVAFMGYVRVTPSSLNKSKRATLWFFGACVIGFSIWAAVMAILLYTGVLLQISNATGGDQFFLIPSFIIGLLLGAFIGEMLGKYERVKRFFFKTEEAQ
jgi:hypothetical protein